MKTKNLLFTIGLAGLTTFSSNAQTQPPNGAFENWINVGFNAEEPQSWGTPNQLGQGPMFPSVATKETDAMSGFALKLENKEFTQNNDTIRGIALLNGTFQMAQPPVGGLPYTDMPDTLVFYIKGDPQGGDVAWVQAHLTKWNVNTTDTLAAAEYSFSSTISAYTRISIPFINILPGTPDTLHLVLRAGIAGGIATPGSWLLIDDLMFVNTVGIDEVAGDNLFSIYPNPAADELFIKGDFAFPAVLEVYDITGQVVLVQSLNSNFEKVSITHLSKGLYLYRINTEDSRLHIGKVVVE